MRHFSSPALSLLLAGFLTAGLVSCSAPADTDAGSATSPAASTDASDGGGEDTSAAIPPEFTAAVGDGFFLGEERVDEASGLVDEVEVRTYRPIRISPDSPLLDYEITEDYALQDSDWIGMMELPDDDSDAAMSTASRFVVETWMDSPIYWETDPEQNTAWLEQNADAFAESIHEPVVKDLTSPGYRIWVIGAFNPNPDGSSTDNTTKAGPAYDIAPTRWSDIEITPTLAIGARGDGGDEPTEYAYVKYDVTANQLLMMEGTDSEPAPRARPFTAHVGLTLVRYEGNDEWQVYGIHSQWTTNGDPAPELEHPWN